MKLSAADLNLSRWQSAPRWLVAYSGGVDSHVLLHLLAQLREQSPDSVPELLAIHINHQLQAQSFDWAQHCQAVCKALNIPLLTETVEVARSGGESLEAQARVARYQAFEKQLQAGDCLLLAHHLDDQLETGLLRLLRGSGVLGLGAMAGQRKLGRGHLLRPLLAIPRQQIVAYAENEGLQWAEDSSNRDKDFSRNYLRHDVLPVIEHRWPQYRQSMTRAIKLSQEASELNTALAEIDCRQLGVNPSEQKLALESLLSLDRPRQKNLLRYWIRQRDLPLPSAAQLQAILEQLVAADEDAEPLVTWAGIAARRFRGHLYILPLLAEFDREQCYAWDHRQRLLLAGNGSLCSEAVIGQGLKNNREFNVRFRRGGERCQPLNRVASQTLKKLFQEYAVPPWLRDRVPLIYVGDALAAVGGYWVCKDFAAGEGDEGITIHWTLP